MFHATDCQSTCHLAHSHPEKARHKPNLQQLGERVTNIKFIFYLSLSLRSQLKERKPPYHLTWNVK